MVWGLECLVIDIVIANWVIIWQRYSDGAGQLGLGVWRYWVATLRTLVTHSPLLMGITPPLTIAHGHHAISHGHNAIAHVQHATHSPSPMAIGVFDCLLWQRLLAPHPCRRKSTSSHILDLRLGRVRVRVRIRIRVRVRARVTVMFWIYGEYFVLICFNYFIQR